MATRFYPDPTNAPSVSPGFGTWWDTTQAVRRKLVIDVPGNNGSTSFQVDETATYIDTILVAQFVSEPLDALDPIALEVIKECFRILESNAKAEVTWRFRIRKCDGDGNNDADVNANSFSDTTEADDGGLTNRFMSKINQDDGAISQGQRLVIEVGFLFNYSKVSGYNATLSITDNHATDLGENDTDTTAYNSWIETGDTFTEASGEPAAIKLGPIFTFA